MCRHMIRHILFNKLLYYHYCPLKMDGVKN